jgi:DnaJ homolog subfamily C member 9
VRDEYKGSAEEREDLLREYEKFEGRFDKLYDVIMLSDVLEDDDRFRKIINDAIAKEEVDSYPAWERENKDEQREKVKARERKRREEFDKRHGSTKEAAEKLKAKQKSKNKSTSSSTSGLGDLAALIQQRQRGRMGAGFFDNLEAKYASKASPRGKKRVSEEPTEEEFKAARERINKRAKSNRAAPKKKSVYEEADEEEEEAEFTGSEDLSEEEAPKSKKRGKATNDRVKVKA